MFESDFIFTLLMIALLTFLSFRFLIVGKTSRKKPREVFQIIYFD